MKCITAIVITVGLLCCTTAHAGNITIWNTPQHGANSFNRTPPDEAYFRALKATGVSWVRLAFSKWHGAGRDFLIGDADHYNGIPPADLRTLIQVMDAAHHAGLKVVLVPLSLPGNRWNQHNGGRPDDRLWNDHAYWVQSAAFWCDLALAVKNHPALAGYNLINEPMPEKPLGLDAQATADVRQAWYAKYHGTSHDLPGFYTFLIAAIRQIDPVTPVMVDSGWSANAWGFSYWPKPLADNNVLYAFHMYEPYEATSATDTAHPYPGISAWFGPQQLVWNKAVMARYLAGPFAWAAANGVPQSRVVVSEFGCMRQWADCGAYLGDVLDILNNRSAHWAFYAFREDGWDGMDYEIPADFTSRQFYDFMGQAKAGNIPRTPHPLMDVITAHMN